MCLSQERKEEERLFVSLRRGVSETIRATAGWCEVPREWKLCPGTSGFLVKGLCREKPARLFAALAACHVSKHEPALSGQLDLLEDSANDKAANLWEWEVVKLSETTSYLELLWRRYKCRTRSFTLAKTSTLGKEASLPAHQPLGFDMGKGMQSFDPKNWCFGKASIFYCILSSVPSLQSCKIILLSRVLLLASCNSHRQQLC